MQLGVEGLHLGCKHAHGCRQFEIHNRGVAKASMFNANNLVLTKEGRSWLTQMAVVCNNEEKAPRRRGVRGRRRKENAQAEPHNGASNTSLPVKKAMQTKESGASLDSMRDTIPQPPKEDIRDMGSSAVSTSQSAANDDHDEVWTKSFPAYMRSKRGDASRQMWSKGLKSTNGSSFIGSPKGVGEQAAAEATAAVRAAAEASLRGSVGANRSKEEVKAAVKAAATSILGPPCSTAQHPLQRHEGELQNLLIDDPIWAAIRAEARLEAQNEALLSSFLYASILEHPCFERSLGFVLANRLTNMTFLATQLVEIFDDALQEPYIRIAIRADVQAVKDRDPSCRSYSQALLYYKGYHALQSYRIAHVLWNRGQRVLALALQSRISEVFAVDIHPAARIGCGILLDHGTGVVIGETAEIKDHVSLLQGVTLGGTGKEAGDRHPKIEEGVLLGAGATVLGNIVIGKNSMVASGSLVLKEVPPHSMVAGTPARVVGEVVEPQPALTMKHDASSFCRDWESAVRAQVLVEIDEGAGI